MLKVSVIEILLDLFCIKNSKSKSTTNLKSVAFPVWSVAIGVLLYLEFIITLKFLSLLFLVYLFNLRLSVLFIVLSPVNSNDVIEKLLFLFCLYIEVYPHPSRDVNKIIINKILNIITI